MAQRFIDGVNAEYERLHTAFEAQFWGMKMGLTSAHAPLSGAAPGLADAFVAPKLYVLFVAGGHFKGFTLSERHPKVASYWAAISAHEAFCKTRYPEAEMLHGWAEARGEVESEGPGCAIEW